MEYKDPITVSPNNYRLLLEDGHYRIVEMWLPAGTSGAAGASGTAPASATPAAPASAASAAAK